MAIKITQNIINNIEPTGRIFEIRDADVKGFMIRVQQSGKASYYFAYSSPDGRRPKILIGDINTLTPQKARKIAQEYRLKVSQGIDPQAEIKERKEEQKKATASTLKVFIDTLYIPFIDTHHKTPRNAKLRLETFKTLWGDKPLSSFTHKQLEDYRQRRLETVKPATINREMNVLQGLFTKAIEWGYIDETPFKRLKSLKVDSKGVIRHLSDTEEKTLRQALRQRDKDARMKRQSSDEWHMQRGYELHTARYDNHTYIDYLEPFILLALNTGMRKGELLTLTWGDVKLNQSLFSLRGENTKSSQSRTIHMSKEAREMIQHQYLQTQIQERHIRMLKQLLKT